MPEKRKFVGFKCSLELYKKIQERAKKEFRTVGGLIRKIVEEKLRELEGKSRKEE